MKYVFRLQVIATGNMLNTFSKTHCFINQEKRMKPRKATVAILTFLVCITVSSVQAQKNSSPADGRDAINKTTKELGLSDTQRSKVETILNTEKMKVEAVFNEERKKLQSIQEETRSSLKAVLTPEQMEKLENKMRQEGKKNATQKK
jgi:Spy/CpxP family protein refolding chaperone